MISIIRQTYDRFFGAGDAAVTVPPMDGALLPNDALDKADNLHSTEAPDNLVIHDGQVLFSSGNELLHLDAEAGAAVIERFSGDILALASGGGRLAVAVAGEGIRIDGKPVGREIGRTDCVTALCFEPSGALLVAVGSERNAAADWARDLLERNATGALWRVTPDGAARRLAAGLAWPAGLAVLADGRVAVSEAWRHRLVAIGNGGTPAVLLDNLPAYPGRIAVSDGGYWLSLFAPRRQMIEFILREKSFRQKMMRDIDPELWMAPALSSGSSFREPLQGGAVKQLGVLKPWAPTRSYGLLVRLGATFHAEASFHSRADGNRHGITSAVAHAGRIYVTSKGGHAVVALSDGGKSEESGR